MVLHIAHSKLVEEEKKVQREMCKTHTYTYSLTTIQNSTKKPIENDLNFLFQWMEKVFR